MGTETATSETDLQRFRHLDGPFTKFNELRVMASYATVITMWFSG